MTLPGGLSFRTRLVRDVEDLQQRIGGQAMEIRQLEGGGLSGSVTHGAVGNFEVRIGRFSRALRAEGILSRDRQVIGMLIDCDKPVSVWSLDVRPGDVVFDRYGSGHESIYQGRTSFATIVLDPPELAEFVNGEAAIADVDFWRRRTKMAPDPGLAASITRRFRTIVDNLENGTAMLSPDGSEFWKRALVEAFVAAISNGIPADRNSGPVKSALIVRQVDELLRQHEHRPLHISQICRTLGVSRRSLHRAFSEVLGIGPVTYFRRQRLNIARKIIKEGQAQSITDVALNLGFDDLGRFSGYYHQLFGERPSATAKRYAAERAASLSGDVRAAGDAVRAGMTRAA